MRRLALRCYPPSFRSRYGEELAALVEDLGERRGSTLDLWVGVLSAWLQPRLRADVRRRMLATVITVWISWCASFLIVPAVDKALLDPVMGGVTPSVRGLLVVADVAWAIGAIAVGVQTIALAAILLAGIDPAPNRWRQLTWFSGAVAAAILVMVTACASAALLAGDPELFGASQPVYAALVVAALAAVVAVTSGARGVRAGVRSARRSA